MKVAYNACFGGFGLSILAENEYNKKKGINLTWYEGVGRYPFTSHRRVDDIESIKGNPFTISASTEDLGPEIGIIPEDKYFCQRYREDEARTDPDLIEVIERLGAKANGAHADLAIAEIPDGAEFEIDEYGGNEKVVPPRPSWPDANQ